MISEVVHRAGYDLSQWQSIAMLLSDARKKLSPEDYMPFYNAVTTYSRSRGTDTEALATIESVVSGWNSNVEELTRSEEVPAVESREDAADEILAAAMQEVEPEPESVLPQNTTMLQEVETPVPPHTPASTPIPAPEKEPQKIMTVDEAKARILVIKNEIHELIGNPVALIGDMGQLGKDYMTALLQASRATMGGSGGGVMPAMQALEDAYEKLRTSAMTGEVPEEQMQPEPKPELEPEPESVSTSELEDKFEPVISPEPVIQEPVPEVLEVPRIEEAPKEIVQRTVVPQRNVEVAIENELEPLEQPAPVVENDESTNIAEPSTPEVVTSTKPVAVKEREEPELEPEPEPVPRISPYEQEEKEVLHDVEIETLRKQLAELESKLKEKAEPVASVEIQEAPEPVHTPAPVSREEPLESAHVARQVKTSGAPAPQITETVAPAAPIRLKEHRPVVDIRTAFSALDHTEKEKMYQSEAVTDGLRSLLMSWEIFRGGFLSGKERGIEHPLYKTMHDVVMSDILAGKFQGAKTNVIISVNDYVNAWRFEQGVEFNPAETFEHYLRRVIHRILTRAGELT